MQRRNVSNNEMIAVAVAFFFIIGGYLTYDVVRKEQYAKRARLYQQCLDTHRPTPSVCGAEPEF